MTTTCKPILASLAILAISCSTVLGQDDLAKAKAKLQPLRNQLVKRGATVQMVDDAKLQAGIRAGNPQIVGLGISSSTAGAPTTVHVLVANWGGTTATGELIATYFSGPSGNLAEDIVSGMAARDTSWPMISVSPIGPIDPGQTSGWQQLTFTVPSNAAADATYIDNWVLWQAGSFDKGTYFGRASIERKIVR